MPKFVARSRHSVATVASTALIGASLAVLLLPVSTPLASAAAAPGSTLRASLASPNNTASETGGTESMLSGNGQSVAFVSQSRLDPSIDVGSGEAVPYRNVFVRDLHDPAKPRTVMISRGQFDPPTGGGDSTGGVHFGPNKLLELQPGGGSDGQDGVPIRDTAPNGDSNNPSISADGRFVAFSTEMTNMFLEDQDSRGEIVIVDRDPDSDGTYDEVKPVASGVASKDYKYYRVSQRDGGFGSAALPKLAANASRIVWEADSEGVELLTATLNLSAGTLGPIQRVPTPAILNHFLNTQDDPAISGDGNHILMHTAYRESCDCNNPPGFHAIMSVDMRQRNDIIRVDVEGGKAISNSLTEVVQHPAVNDDGTVIAFSAEQHTLVGDDPPSDVSSLEPTTYVVKVAGDKVTRTDIVSRDNKFKIINGDRPGLSRDGRYLAFVTNDLGAHDGNDGRETNSDCIEPVQSTVRNSGEPMLRLNALPPRRNAPHTTCQVIVRDLIVDFDWLVGERPLSERLPGTLVSPNTAGNAGNGNTVPNIERLFFEPKSTAPSLSDDGGRVAYDSDATDLVSQPADTNRRSDVFVRTLEPGLTGTTVDFGPVELGQSSTRTAVLTETGSGPLVVEAISIIGTNSGDFTVGAQTCTRTTIHETSGCEVAVTFGPRAIGDRRAQLLVQIRGGRRTVVDLTGSGKEQPVPQPKGPTFSVSPDTLAFGNRLLLSNGPESTVTITNDGGSPLLISPVDIVGPTSPEDYKVTKNTCGAPVPGNGGQCTVSVAFSPRGTGDRNAVLRFTHNAPGGTSLVGLTGSAPQPTIEVSPGVTPPGRVVTVIGKDFPPNKVIAVKFLDRVGDTSVKTGDDGTFRAPLLVFPKAAPETRSVLASVPDFTDPLARSQLLIVFPTVSPANFVVRG